MSARACRAAVVAWATSAVLLAPSVALAVTGDELRDLDSGPAGPDPAPHVGSSGLGSAGRVLLGLLAVVALIMAVHWLLRRTGRGAAGLRGGGGAEGLDVLSTTSLGASGRLHLVRVADEVLLLGATDAGIRTLHRLEHDQAVAHGLLPDTDGEDPDATLAARPGLVTSPVAPAGRGGSGGPSLLQTLRDRTTR